MTISLAPSENDKYVVAALDRSLELLEQLAVTPDIGVSEIAKRTGSTKTQAFRLLYTLERRGYVIKDSSTRTYALSYRLLYLAEHVNVQTALIRTSRPYMHELALSTGENVHLIVRDELESVCIALEKSAQPVRLYAEVGRPGPLYAGGGSTVLLAYAPREIEEKVLSETLKAYTPRTVTNPRQIQVLLAEIRQRGYHLAEEDVDFGAYSVAAPIYNYNKLVVAALSIAGPLSRLNDETRQVHTQKILEVTKAISRELGV